MGTTVLDRSLRGRQGLGLAAPGPYLRDLLTQLRVRHYVKNLFVLMPLVFSLNMFEAKFLVNALQMFAGFSLAASFVYLINDLNDRPWDAQHPQKCQRPLAAGRISVTTARGLAVACALGSGYLAARINIESLGVVIAYMSLNVLYTYSLKNQPILDVSSISVSFMLRVIAGGVATGIALSSWMLLTVMALSFYLGFGKRRQEYELVYAGGDDRPVTRSALQRYNLRFLNAAMATMLALTIAFYALWSIQPLIPSKLVYTTFLVVLILLRYSLVVEGGSDGDPTEVVLGDRTLQALVGLYATTTLVLIYAG